MGINAFVQRVAAERERRFRDPAFQRELALERRKFGESLKTMGENGLDTAYSLLLKAPLTPLWKSLQVAAGTKKGKRKMEMGDVFMDTFKEFGKAGWKATKFAASALVAGGRAVKLGIRYVAAV
jgi:hypothetical protein